MVAEEQCYEPTVRRLLDWNAKVNLKDKRGDDALMGAASAYCIEPSTRKAQAQIIKLLIARGADPNSTDDVGLTPLMLLTAYPHADSSFLQVSIEFFCFSSTGVQFPFTTLTGLFHKKCNLLKARVVIYA